MLSVVVQGFFNSFASIDPLGIWANPTDFVSENTLNIHKIYIGLQKTKLKSWTKISNTNYIIILPFKMH